MKAPPVRAFVALELKAALERAFEIVVALLQHSLSVKAACEG